MARLSIIEGHAQAFLSRHALLKLRLGTHTGIPCPNHRVPDYVIVRPCQFVTGDTRNYILKIYYIK